jgi:hypothetical protein
MLLRQARGGDKLPFELREVSSAQALAERLAEVFTATGMTVECAVRRARARVPRPSAPGGREGERLRQSRFVGRWLGTTAFAAAVPPAGPDVRAADEIAAPGELVVEAGLLVLVAKRA